VLVLEVWERPPGRHSFNRHFCNAFGADELRELAFVATDTGAKFVFSVPDHRRQYPLLKMLQPLDEYRHEAPNDQVERRAALTFAKLKD